MENKRTRRIRKLRNPELVDLKSLLNFIDKEVQFVHKMTKVNKEKLNISFII